MFIRKLLLLTVFISLLSCEKKQEQQTAREINTSPVEVKDSLRMSRSELKNKVMGMLLGTAIGDAMGAPTEMWSREQIKSQYGYVADLDTMVRAPSAEGTWQYNLPAGGTTDDTRWKKLMAEFIIAQPAPATELKPVAFADHILRQYEEDIQQLKTTDGFDPEPFEDNLRRMAWLQEWALVAKPYAAGDLDGYAAALSRFYGGEMTCAGMLYLPAIGALYPAQPGQAYRAAFQLGFFDLGYARDISALTAAMVAAAMAAEPTPASVINVIRDIDPQHYFKSRLVGRAAYRILEEARNIVFQARQPTMQDMSSAKVEQ
ncbi:MAG: ADP-ribosylglycohydrolase family protein, partial [bacterium]